MDLKKNMYYKLDENKNVIPANVEECEKILINENNEKIVKQEYVGDKFISTVFLPIDHNFNPDGGIPIVFETMIFEGNRSDIYIERYSTWEEAEDGHQRATEWVKNGCTEKDNLENIE